MFGNTPVNPHPKNLVSVHFKGKHTVYMSHKPSSQMFSHNVIQEQWCFFVFYIAQQLVGLLTFPLEYVALSSGC